MFTTALRPKMMPLGLIRNTRPLDSIWPRMADGFCPTMRLSTALLALRCRKRVISPWLMEKPFQLMMALGLLVMLRTSPEEVG